MRRVFLALIPALIILGACLPGHAHFSGVKICVDPGHGGSDPGAVGNGLYEKDINLDIGLRARDMFQLDSATVIMTRTTDVYVSLQGRCDIANNNGANRFVCTHCNAFNGAAYGTETFCHPNGSSTSYDLRNKINPEMVAHMGTYNRGVKTADFYVLRNTNMPAAGWRFSWSPDGRYVIFERTTDDGQRILTSDLWMASWDGSWVYQLTSTGVIEGYPSWSPDGSWIAYVIDGVVYIAPIEM